MAELMVKGKSVTVPDSFPVDEYWGLPQLISAVGTGEDIDYRKAAPLLAAVITEWGFVGDPTDAATYEKMELFRELIPITNALTEYLTGEMGLGEAD